MFTPGSKLWIKWFIQKAIDTTKEDVNASCVYLDASDIWERSGDAPFTDTLVYSAIELVLYRNELYRTAKVFHSLWEDERTNRPRLFFEQEK